MAQTQIEARYGSDAGIYDHRELAKARFSDFPIGRKNDFTIDPGAIVPVDIWPTLPGDEFDISIRYLLKTMPLVAAPFTVYHVRTHWYYCKGSDLWAGFNTMITKGRSGTISVSVPTASAFSGFYPPRDSGNRLPSEYFSASVPQGLPTYLGIPPHYFNNATGTPHHATDSNRLWPYSAYASLIPNDTSGFITSAGTGRYEARCPVSLLPFMMYQKIYRDNYVSPNLLQDNKIWFPDDVTAGWRIDYSGSNLFASGSTPTGSNNKVMFVPTKDEVPSTDPATHRWSTVPQVADNCINLLALRYAMFENDRFTTALPWSTRGQAPSVEVSSASIPAGTRLATGVYAGIPSSDGSVAKLRYVGSSSAQGPLPASFGSTGDYASTGTLQAFVGNTVYYPTNPDVPSLALDTSAAIPVNLSLGLTADNLRTQKD